MTGPLIKVIKSFREKKKMWV